MVNIGLGFGSLLGITLALAGAGLYFLRTARPALARDHDIFFAAVALLCGCILLFQGWRLDPILLFGQFLLTGSSIFFAVENVRLRSATTAQAKRNVPLVDDERSVSRVYRAELDELTPLKLILKPAGFLAAGIKVMPTERRKISGDNALPPPMAGTVASAIAQAPKVAVLAADPTARAVGTRTMAVISGHLFPVPACIAVVVPPMQLVAPAGAVLPKFNRPQPIAQIMLTIRPWMRNPVIGSDLPVWHPSIRDLQRTNAYHLSLCLG